MQEINTLFYFEFIYLEVKCKSKSSNFALVKTFLIFLPFTPTDVLKDSKFCSLQFFNPFGKTVFLNPLN